MDVWQPPLLYHENIYEKKPFYSISHYLTIWFYGIMEYTWDNINSNTDCIYFIHTGDDEDQPDKPRDDEPAVEPADERNAAPLDDNGGLKRSKRRKNVLKVNMIITEYVL